MIRWLVQKYDGRRVNLRSVPLAKIGIANSPAWPHCPNNWWNKWSHHQTPPPNVPLVPHPRPLTSQRKWWRNGKMKALRKWCYPGHCHQIFGLQKLSQWLFERNFQGEPPTQHKAKTRVSSQVETQHFWWLESRATWAVLNTVSNSVLITSSFAISFRDLYFRFRRHQFHMNHFRELSQRILWKQMCVLSSPIISQFRHPNQTTPPT